MANNLAPPESLKAIKPYMTLATQLEAKNEKVVAYYCRLYSVQNGMQINKTAPESKKFLFTLMDILENTKKELQNEEAVQSNIVGQAYVERHALRIFEAADADDRAAKFTKNLVKQFYSAGLLFDVLNYFGELSEDLVAKKQYAKRKAMYLNRCFSTGETPIAGPLIGEDGQDEFGNSGEHGQTSYQGDQGGASGYSPDKNAHHLPYPSNQGYSPSSSGAPSSSSNQYNQINSGVNNMSIQRPDSSNRNVSNFNTTNDDNKTNYSTINPALMIEAQKLCKHASSALQFDDVATAITKLELCLSLLKTGKQ